MKKFTPEIILLIITLIWGATFALIKTALEDISPMLFIAMRFLISAVILLPFIKIIVKQTDRKTLNGGLILGLLYFLGCAAQTLGLNFTSATKSGFITGTFVIFTPVFQLMIEKRKPHKGNVIGIILVLFGLIFLSSKGESLFDVFNEFGIDFNLGDFLTLICSVFFGLYIVYVDIISKKFHYLPLVFIQILFTGFGGLAGLILFSSTGLEAIKFNFNLYLLFAILYTSILATVTASTLQTKYQKFMSPAKAGIILSFEPIFAALFAFFLLNEKISNFGLLGCLLIFAGLIASEIVVPQKYFEEK